MVWVAVLLAAALVSAAAVRARRGSCLCAASLLSLLLGLSCGASVNFCVFWPDFWVTMSAGLGLAALLHGAQARAA